MFYTSEWRDLEIKWKEVREMVKLVNLAEMTQKMTGTVESIKVIPGKFGKQYELKVLNENNKERTIWYAIPKNFDEQVLARESFLGALMAHLETLKIEADSVTKTFQMLIGRKFAWETSTLDVPRVVKGKLIPVKEL